MTVRRFNINNYLKGKIQWQLPQLIEQDVIKFEKGAKRNTCVVIVNESKIDSLNLKYMYTKLIPENREIKEGD